MSKLTASPELERVLREQDREALRTLIAMKPNDPRDAARIAAQIEALLRLCERTA